MKHTTTRCSLILAIALAGLAQQKPAKPTEPAKQQDPPKITSEMRETFFQAKSDLLEAQARSADAQKRLDASLKEMQAVCPLILDAQGKPQCAPPAPPTEAKGADKK